MDALDANIFISLLTGNAPTPTDDVDRAVAGRFLAIRGQFTQRVGYGYLYGGNRTSPANLGWRFQQQARHTDIVEPTPLMILAGHYDALIERTWHEAAASEYHYRYEKDWG